MKAEAPSLAAEILLLADREEEVSLVRTAAETGHVNVVQGCPSVLSFLRRQGSFVGSPRPDLVILDLDLADQEHCEVLKQIKQDSGFRAIPVVVLASEASPSSVQLAYELHANACLIKPREREEFLRVMRATMTFWLTLARLPERMNKP